MFPFLGMLCTLCQSFTRGDGVVWATVPCVSLFKQSLDRHSKSELHQSTLQHEARRRAAAKDGGIAGALQQQVNIQRTALIGAMDCLYWLAKEEVAHNTKYISLIDLMKRRGAPYMENLHVVSTKFNVFF